MTFMSLWFEEEKLSRRRCQREASPGLMLNAEDACSVCVCAYKVALIFFLHIPIRWACSNLAAVRRPGAPQQILAKKTNSGSESGKGEQHPFCKSDFMYDWNTFSKLWTLPWNIFTHLSLGANGRTSQIRTTTRQGMSLISDHFENKPKQNVNGATALGNLCCPWSWREGTSPLSSGWVQSQSRRGRACCRSACSASGPTPVPQTREVTLPAGSCLMKRDAAWSQGKKKRKEFPSPTWAVQQENSTTRYCCCSEVSL